MNLKINHLQHIGLPISDVEKSKAFYERLGFKHKSDDRFFVLEPDAFELMARRTEP